MFPSILKQHNRLTRKIRTYISIQRVGDTSADNTNLQAPNKSRHGSENDVQSRYQSHDVKPRTYEPFPFEVNEQNKADIVRRVMTPLCDTPYTEQLASKESHCRSILRSLGKQLSENGTPVRLYANELPCQVESIVPATHLTRYRNHTEFNIWHGYDNRTETVGYNVFSLSKHGDTICVEPCSCDHLAEIIIKGADVVQDFMRTQARLSISISSKIGGWKRCRIRSNYKDELMIVGIINPLGLKPQEIVDEIDNFKEFIVSECEMRGIGLASLYFEESRFRQFKPPQLLHGSPHLEDLVGEFKFQAISTSNSNVNRTGDGLLYKCVKNTIDRCYSFKEKNIKPLILNDLCGCGLLAINLADMAHKVIGIDGSRFVIDNARLNAKLNGATNVKFVYSNLDLVIGRLSQNHSKDRQAKLVVCYAKNAGLEPSTIEVLKDTEGIDKVIYISTNESVSLNNLVKLCSKTSNTNLQPLVPVLATPVDIAPHTRGYRTIIAMERMRT